MLTSTRRQHHTHNPCCADLLLQELLAIQQSDGPKNLGFFGTRNMGMTHQKLVEILSYAMVSTVSDSSKEQQEQRPSFRCDCRAPMWVCAGPTWTSTVATAVQ